MKKVKKKYVGKVKNGLLARCPTCKTKGYTAKRLVVRQMKITINKKEEERNFYDLEKVPCEECKGTGVILWIDRIMRKKPDEKI